MSLRSIRTQSPKIKNGKLQIRNTRANVVPGTFRGTTTHTTASIGSKLKIEKKENADHDFLKKFKYLIFR